ncbi:MAG TPA: hypothetical protein VMM18_00180 [Gemmatimonadaceae bacterium]|nr:hypothetical protein [Gemmatimonadaceae bacterium]
MSAWAPLLLFAVLPPLSGPMRSATLAAACHTPISSAETLDQLMPVLGAPLAPGLPMDVLRTVDTQPRPEVSYDRVSVVASVSTGLFRPVISWSPSAHGSSILHELVHVAQRRLPAPQLRALKAEIRSHDRQDGFSAYVVRGATNSVVVSIRELLPPQQARAFAARIDAEVAMLPQGGVDALEARFDMLHQALGEGQWRRARRALQTTQPPRFGWASRIIGEPWSWEDELRAKLLLEAMAYDADARCLRGHGPRFTITL